MKKKKLWMLTFILTCGLTLTACSNSENTTTADLTVLTEWQAGKTVSEDVVATYGGRL